MKGDGNINLLFGEAGDDVLEGGASTDYLYGGPGIDWLGFTGEGVGHESQDEINGGWNLYDGGTGNDRISGSTNKDVYLFRRGDGFDYVLTNGGADDLLLIANVDLGNGLLSEITQDQVSFNREGLDLLVCINRDDGTVSDHVRIAAWFDSGASANALGSVTLRSAVEGTVFRTWNKEEIEGIALNAIGSEQGDTLAGLNHYRNVLQGRAGSDTLIGANGSVSSTALGDTFIGGTGDDDMTGTGSGDTYIYFRGDGHDTITEQNDSMAFQDEVVFTDIALEEVGFTRVGNDLRVVLPADGSVTVKDWFLSGENRQVEFMSFTDQRLSAADITARVGIVLTQGVDAFTGTSASEIIYALGGADNVGGDPSSPYDLQGASDTIFAGAGDDTVYGRGGNDRLFGQSGIDKLYGGAGNDVLDGGDNNDTLDGGAGADTLIGGAGDDVLGGEANSADSGSNGGGYFVSPGAGNTYIGGSGNDTLRGTALADLYEFNLGDGHDTLTEPNIAYAPAGQLDVLRLGAGIAPPDIKVLRSGNDLVLRHVNGTDSVTVKSWFTSQGSTLNQVEEIQFADGTVWLAAGLTAGALELTGTALGETLTGHSGYPNTIDGGAGNDTITGGSLGDKLYGGDGDDKLYGQDGADELYGGLNNDLLDGGRGRDLLVGGQGADTLGGGVNTLDQGYNLFMNFQDPGAGNIYEGGPGNDTLNGTIRADEYRFNLGDGADTVIEPNVTGQPAGQIDVLKFGPGIAAADISVRRSGEDLVLAHVNGVDRVTVRSWYTTQGATAYQVEEVQFDDGTTWLAPQLTERGLAVTGTAVGETLTGLGGYSNTLLGEGGNDALVGGDLADTLYGGAGNDVLSGSWGNDLYRYAAGDGYDTVTDSSGAADTLEFLNLDISAATFYRVGNDLEAFMGAGQGVLVKNQFATGGAMEFMLFGGQSYSASQIAALAGPKP